MDYGRELSFGLFPVPAVDDAVLIVRRAQLAERSGFDLIGIQDHPYKGDYLDTWSLLCFLAGATSSITLFPDVVSLPLRPAPVLAQAASSIDILSGGRFELGLGAGGFPAQIEAMGGARLEGGAAVAALEEAIEVIRLMWSSTAPISYKGAYLEVRGLEPGPAPAHAMGIHLGAYKPRMLQLIGAKADGWVPSSRRIGRAELEQGNARIDEAAALASRPPSAIRRFFNITGAVLATDEAEPYRWSVKRWVHELSALALEVGIDTFVFWLSGEVESQIERFGHEIVPAVREEVRATRAGSAR